MNPEKKICVFSLSKRDIFRDIEHAVEWLNEEKREKPYYYFRKTKPKNGLPSGSIILFSFEAKIFGEAKVKEDIQKVSSEEQKQLKNKYGHIYKHKMTLNPSSIDIFKKPYPTKKEVAEKLGIGFARLFKYLNWEQYQQILKMTGIQRR